MRFLTSDHITEAHHVVDLTPPMFTHPSISTCIIRVYCRRQNVLVRVLWRSLVVVVKIVAGHDARVPIGPWQHKSYCHLEQKLRGRIINFYVKTLFLTIYTEEFYTSLYNELVQSAGLTCIGTPDFDSYRTHNSPFEEPILWYRTHKVNNSNIKTHHCTWL